MIWCSQFAIGLLPGGVEDFPFHCVVVPPALADQGEDVWMRKVVACDVSALSILEVTSVGNVLDHVTLVNTTSTIWNSVDGQDICASDRSQEKGFWDHV